MSEYRGDALYVSNRAKRALRMLAKAAGKPADALADEVLVDWLNTHHGPVLAFIDTQDKARADFETSLIPATARFERINQEME